MTDEIDPARNRASRWSIMLDRLATTGRLGVGEAAELLSVSEATIRRDFSELAKRQLVARNHGGVVATSVAYELPYRYRSSLADDDRTRVADAAAGLVEPGQVIGLNGGTTTTATARAITGREDLAADGGEITLVTNALNIATEAVLRPHVQCVSLGGVARPESYEVTGPLATLVLQQLWLDVAFVGVNGLTGARGRDVPPRGGGGDHPHHDRALQAGHLRHDRRQARRTHLRGHLSRRADRPSRHYRGR